MKPTLLALLAVSALFSSAPARAAQDATPAAYADENSSDPAPLKLHDLEGDVRGLGGDPMPRASVSLFAESTHALIATVMSDKAGKFRFDKVGNGLYRVVAHIEGLCTANIPVEIESSPLAHRKLIITMRPKDIDTCSYGMAK